MESPQLETNIRSQRSFWQFIKSFGPGIIVVFTWIGAGDLTNAAVSGSGYGYALMWILALSLIIRYVIVNIMSRYQLCNSEGITILEGFNRLHIFFPIYIGIFALIMGHLFNSYMISGAGEALAWLTHFDHPFIWSVVIVLASLFVIRKNIFNTIENILKVLLGLMTVSFIALAIWSTPDVTGMIKGTVGFDIPSDVGVYGAFLIAVSLVGAVAGSVANFLYPYYMKEKGWVKPEHKKIQRNDLLFAIIMAIIITLSVWIVGAEILKPNGIQVNSIADLSNALSLHLGYFGAFLFYIGTFSILYSSVVGFANGFPKVIVDALHKLKPERKEKYGEKFENDPMFKWFSLFILVTPIIWSIPGMPGFVTMVVYVNILSVIGLPVISIGILILANQKILGKYRNNWFENVLLAATTILAVWSSIKIVTDMFS